MMKHSKTTPAIALLVPIYLFTACSGDCGDENLTGSGGGGGGGIGSNNFLSIGDVTLPEGDTGTSTFEFPLSLNEAISQSITVTFSTLDGSARSSEDGQDFEARTGSIVLAAGTMEAMVEITVRGDQDYEGDEVFYVELLEVEGFDVAIGDAQAIGTIREDDGHKFSISDVSSIEGDITNPLFWFEVTLSTPHDEATSVEYVTRDGTAIHGPAPDDYIWRRATLEFAPGETSKTFEIRIVGDLGVEPDEYFELQLFDPTGPGVGIAKGIGVGTILDDDTEELVDQAIPGSNASRPQIAGVGDFVYAVWQDDRSGSSDVYFSRSVNDGLDWSATNRRLDTAPIGAGESFEPQIAAEEDFVYVVWEDTRNGRSDIYFNRSTDRGSTWLASDVRLDTDFPGENASKRPRLACSGENVYVVWLDWRSGASGVRFNSSFDGGSSWQPSDQRIDGSTEFGPPATGAEICASGQRVHVVWSDERDGASDIYYDTSADGGFGWQEADRRLDSTLPGSSRSDELAIAGDGSRVYVVWQDERWGYPDIYFNRSLDDGAHWLPFDLRLDDDPIGTGIATNPDLFCDGDTVMATWEDKKVGELEDIRFSSSSDGGTIWRANSRVDRNEDVGIARSFDPQVSWNGNRVAVTWADERNGQLDVYVGWSLDEGSTFTPNLLRMDRDEPGVAASEHPQILRSGSSFHVIWHDARATQDVLFRTVFLP